MTTDAANQSIKYISISVSFINLTTNNSPAWFFFAEYDESSDTVTVANLGLETIVTQGKVLAQNSIRETADTLILVSEYFNNDM